MKYSATRLLIACTALFSSNAFAEELKVELKDIGLTSSGDSVGTVTLSDSPRGLVIKADLKNLAPGVHGFHVHEIPDCGPGIKDGQPAAGLAAGGHLDPEKTGKHLGPEGKGHLGDLPALEVAKDGTSTKELLAPRLKLADVKDRSLMLHAGGDNYSDKPEPLGGGGARMACGVIR